MSVSINFHRIARMESETGQNHTWLHIEDKDGNVISLHVGSDAAHALADAWNALALCEACKRRVESVNEADQCEACHDEYVKTEARRLKPLYDAEKRAGLLKPKDELDAELRDAGRGHLVRP